MCPVEMVPDSSVLFTCNSMQSDESDLEDRIVEDVFVSIDPDLAVEGSSLEADDVGKCIDLDVTSEMPKLFLNEDQVLPEGHHAALRVYVTNAAKRVVVVKDDDIMTRKEIWDNQREVAKATFLEFKTSMVNKCFKKR